MKNKTIYTHCDECLISLKLKDEYERTRVRAEDLMFWKLCTFCFTRLLMDDQMKAKYFN